MDRTLTNNKSAKKGMDSEEAFLSHKTLGEALEEDESGFQKILDHVPLGYQSLDKNGHFLQVNQAWLDILGYSREEVIERSFTDFLHPDWIEYFKESFLRFKTSGEILGVEFELVKKDGSPIYIYFNGKIEYDEKGRFRKTHCILYDITERKKMRDALQNSCDKLKSKISERNKFLRDSNSNLIEVIKERKRVESKLCESETRFKDLLENLSDVAYETDISGNIIYVNRMAEKVTGLTLKEIIGKSFLPLMAQQSKSKAMEVYQRTLQGESTEFELTLFNGNICHFKNEPLRNPVGQITGVLGIARDISDRKKAEQQIIKEKNFSDVLINSLPGIFYLFDKDGRLLRWNKNFEEISDYSFEEIRHLKVTDFFEGKDKEQIAEKIKEALTVGRAQVEAYFWTKSGNKIPYFFTGLRMITDERPYITGVGIDITERKNAEEVIRRSEERFRTVADFAHDWEYWIDPGGKLLYVSPSCKRISGYTTKEFMDNPFLIYDIVHPDDRDKVRAHAETAKTPTEHLEFRITNRDGEERWIGHVCQPVFSEEGKWLGRRGSNRDITERKLAEEAVRENEKRYRILTENVADGITIYQDGRLVFVNPAFTSMIGYGLEELIGMDPIHLMHDDYKEKFRIIAQSFEQNVSKEPFQSIWIRKNRREIWTEAYHNTIQYRGKPALLCTVRDITRHKHHEIAMEEEREHLHKENVKLRANIKDRYKFGEIIGKSSGMQEVYELIMSAASSDANVIINGESGTGKELIACTIHEMGDRKEMPFVPVNCGAVPEALFESEFFGHKKGAFTGAQIDKHGFFDLAHGGTLFLDEVGELTLNLQAKLLRVIEGGGYMAVGGREINQTKARIIAATNRDLAGMVQKGLFREDFFYRLHVIPITVPPLRKRKEDIPLLVDHYLERHGNGTNRQIISGQILEKLCDHFWPGNVRELQNLLQRFISLNRLDFITAEACQESFSTDMAMEKSYQEGGSLRETLENFERGFISKVLEQNRWHRGKTAETLGIPERTLYRKLRQYQLN